MAGGRRRGKAYRKITLRRPLPEASRAIWKLSLLGASGPAAKMGSSPVLDRVGHSVFPRYPGRRLALDLREVRIRGEGAVFVRLGAEIVECQGGADEYLRTGEFPANNSYLDRAKRQLGVDRCDQFGFTLGGHANRNRTLIQAPRDFGRLSGESGRQSFPFRIRSGPMSSASSTLSASRSRSTPLSVLGPARTACGQSASRCRTTRIPMPRSIRLQTGTGPSIRQSTFRSRSP